jgi:hypothetical protein
VDRLTAAPAFAITRAIFGGMVLLGTRMAATLSLIFVFLLFLLPSLLTNSGSRPVFCTAANESSPEFVISHEPTAGGQFGAENFCKNTLDAYSLRE